MIRSLLRMSLLAMFSLVVLMLSGCGPFDSGSGNYTGEEPTVKIGALLPLTGSMASTGRGMRTAINVGIEDINRHLKVEGYDFRLSVEFADTGTDPDTALAMLQRFKNEGITLVIGPGSSAEAAAVLDYADNNGIMLISSSTAPSLAIAGDNMLRLVPSDTYQAQGLAMLMHDTDSKTHIVTVNSDDNYGSELSTAVITDFSGLGGVVDATINYTEGSVNYAALVSQIETAVTNSIASAGAANLVAVQLTSHEEAVNILAAADSSAVLKSVKWYGSDGNADHSIILANASAADFAAAVHFTSSSFTVEESSLGMPKKVIPDRSLRQRIYSAYGAVTDPTALIGYDAVWLIGLALMDKGETATAADVISSIYNITTDTEPGLAGVSGRLELTDAGDKEDSGYSFYEVTSTTTSEVTHAYTFSGVTPQIIAVTDTGVSFTPVAGNVIKMGVLVTETGDLGEAGMSALKGIQDAASALNNYYAFYGSENRVELEVKDAGTTSAEALAALDELHADGITLVTGMVSSDITSALLANINAYGMYYISAGSTSESLAVAGDNLYRFILSDSSMTDALGMLMTADGKTHVTIIYRNDTWGTELKDSVTAYLTGNGATVNAAVAYTPGDESSYSTAVDTAETAAGASVTANGASVNAVLMLSYSEGTDIMEYAASKTALSQVAWYGGDGFAKSNSLFSSAAATSFAVSRGLTCALYSILEVGSKTVPEPISRIVVRDRLRDRLGYDPITYAYTGWDSVWIGALAYAEYLTSADFNTDIITQSNNYIGLSNYMRLNASGDRMYGEYGFFTVTGSGQWDLTATYHYTPLFTPASITRP